MSKWRPNGWSNPYYNHSKVDALMSIEESITEPTRHKAYEDGANAMLNALRLRQVTNSNGTRLFEWDGEIKRYLYSIPDDPIYQISTGSTNKSHLFYPCKDWYLIQGYWYNTPITINPLSTIIEEGHFCSHCFTQRPSWRTVCWCGR